MLPDLPEKVHSNLAWSDIMPKTSATSGGAAKKKRRSRDAKATTTTTTSTAFDAVRLLDSQDAQADQIRRARSRQSAHQAEAAQSQAQLYGSLVECRILLQRSLQRLTTIIDDQPTTAETGDGPSHDNGGDVDDNDGVTSQCDALLTQLLEARRHLVGNNYPETFRDQDYHALVQQQPDALDVVLQSEYETLRDSSWKEVLNRRHKDVRLHSGLTAKNQYKVLDASFWQQVESVVQHEQQQQRNVTVNDSTTWVFDDSKLYQQMLKDFVTSMPAAASTTTASSNAHSVVNALERLRRTPSASTQPVDRKASKGRKIRYHDIPKLQHFTFPIQRPSAKASLDEDEWFRSLFGGAAAAATSKA